jgi:hypothetical protein
MAGPVTAATSAAPARGGAAVGFDLDAVDAALAGLTDDLCADLDGGSTPEPVAAGTVWGCSVFGDLDVLFARIADGPGAVGIDCTAWADLGLPPRFLTLRALRDWLMTHRTNYQARDAVWHDVVRRARTDPAWVSVAAGMMTPALVQAAGRIARGFRDDPRDIDAEMLTAFLKALRTVDLEAGRLFSKLRWVAVRAGLAVRHAGQPYILVGDIENAVGMAPHLPYGHPDLILQRAVDADVITADEADLISTTRLDAVTVERHAADLGLDPAALRMRRNRAETALVTALHTGTLSGAISQRSREALRRRAARRALVSPVPAS